MSNILFANTDGDTFRPDFYDTSKHYQVSALLKMRPDCLGLRSWDRYKNTLYFNRYKLIWLHLNPRRMEPPWYIYPRLIRKRAPDSILVLKHEWMERYCYDKITEIQKPMEHLLKRYFNMADYIQVNTEIGKKVVEANLKPPVLYYHIGVPMLGPEPPKPLPWRERRGIFTVRHTYRSPMIRKFEIAKEVGLPITVVDSVPPPYADTSEMERLAEWVGAEAKVYPRLEWREYMDVLRRCRMALEMDYVGISRLAYESALVSVPVVGTNLAEYRNMLYPKLTFEPDDVEGMINKLKEIHDRPSAIGLNRRSKKMIREYWSDEACHARLMKLFEEIGYEYER